MTAKRRKCEGGCGRWLRSAESVALGYGRVCAKKLPQSSQDGRAAPQGPGVPPGLSRRLTAPALHPGQTELPLAPMQPTLWSL
jgi:hypothetical protein